MKIHEAKELVERWIDERVEIHSEVVTSSNDAFGDFLKWMKRQRNRGGGVTVNQFDSAMKNNDFEQEYDGSNMVVRGIKLKGD